MFMQNNVTFKPVSDFIISNIFFFKMKDQTRILLQLYTKCGLQTRLQKHTKKKFNFAWKNDFLLFFVVLFCFVFYMKPRFMRLMFLCHLSQSQIQILIFFCFFFFRQFTLDSTSNFFFFLSRLNIQLYNLRLHEMCVEQISA